jgi:ABC-type antimicrobial peptide transport system permease subunit
MGFRIQEVKADGIRAAEGATDFGGLFIGFSLFLIVSSLLLVGLLFRLNIDQRKKEIGVLLATGMRIGLVQKRLLLEGGVLALTGSLIGTALATTYAWFMITALESWWIAAVGTTFLSLHVDTKSLLLGLLISLLICLLTIYLSIRALSRWPVVLLIKGASRTFETTRSKWSVILAVVTFLLACVFTYYAFVNDSAGLFFASGASLLAACIAFFAYRLRLHKSSLRPGTAWITTIQMAVRNGVRNPGRSLLSVSLVAAACFVIVAVGANRRPTESDWRNHRSGTGGFGLVASSAVPIYENLQDPTIQSQYGLDIPDFRFFGFRVLPGDDASCLNLYKPEKPRVLGVPREFIERGGFTFQESLEQVDNPWNLLISPARDFVPAIADYDSARWILKKKLGEDITVIDHRGKPVRLRLVALLKSSLLQSEVLISEENFADHFPGQGGKSYFLIETTLQNRQTILETLEGNLDAYGFDAVPTEQKLAAYHAVENTYLSTFQTLGALGLLLGTLGLGIILIRNVLERRSELATMRAFGYQRKTLGWFVLIENAFLLIVGIAAGTVAATISILPHLLEQSPDVPLASLALTLLLVFIIGMMASITAIFSALRIPLLPALKAEN